MTPQTTRLLLALTAAGFMAVTLACGGGGQNMTGPAPGPVVTPTPSLAGCTTSLSVARQPQSIIRLPSSSLPARGVDSSAERDTVVPERLSLQIASPDLSPEARRTISALGGQQLSLPNPQGFISVSLPRGMDPRAAAARFAGIPGVLRAEPQQYRYKLTTPTDGTYDNVHQWALFVMDMADAWTFTTGSPSVKIAVIDTGYDMNNPELAGKVDASVVYDKGNGTVDVGASAQDGDGHGTNVSGIAAALNNETRSGTNIASVGWNVHLLEARVFPTQTPNPSSSPPGANSADIAAAVNWAVSNGASVINLSLGGGSAPDSSDEATAIASALSAGVSVVAASGNGNAGVGQNTLVCPACDPGVISVGASAVNDLANNTVAGATEKVATYSNYGAGLDVVAPGGDPSSAQQAACKANSANCDFLQWILGLYSSTAFGTPGTFALFAGTSQATPHVAGVVSLMKSKNGTLSPAQVRTIIDSAVDNINDPHQGHGRLNACKALTLTP